MFSSTEKSGKTIAKQRNAPIEICNNVLTENLLFISSLFLSSNEFLQ